MKPKTAEKLVKKLVPYWAKKLKVGKIYLLRDNRIWMGNYVRIWDDMQLFVYNSKRLSKWFKWELVFSIFHELAHLKKKALLEYMDDREKIEYIAETTALKWFKEYFPKYYPKWIKGMKKRLNNPKFLKGSVYRKAYMRIKEYND